MYYFSHHINTEVKEIFWNTFIANIGMSLTTLFEPIFLYGLGYSLIDILWFYCLVYLGYALLVFPGAKIVSRIGYKHAILWSNIFYILYWILLYQIKFHPALFLIAPFLFALQKSLMWPAYHADVAMHSVHSQRGREVGFLFALVQMALITGPLIGGVISSFLGFKELFIISSSVMLLSVYPLFRSPEIYTQHTFRFKNFITILRRYPWNFFGYWGYAEDLMLMTLWPIYIFLAVPALLELGFLVTFASLIAIVIMLYLGRILDQNKRSKALQVISVGYGLTWFFRQFAAGFAGVFAFDTLTRMGKAMINVPMMTLTYRIAGISTADHAIAYAVFMEFALSLGKMFTALIAMWILAATGNIYYVFILSGTITMCYALLRAKK